MNKVATVIPTKWWHVGIQLGVENTQLDMIKQRCANEPLQCFAEVFSEWKRRMTTPFSWKTITEALKSELVGENMLAHKLQAEFESRYSPCTTITTNLHVMPFVLLMYSSVMTTEGTQE